MKDKNQGNIPDKRTLKRHDILMQCVTPAGGNVLQNITGATGKIKQITF